MALGDAESAPDPREPHATLLVRNVGRIVALDCKNNVRVEDIADAKCSSVLSIFDTLAPSEVYVVWIINRFCEAVQVTLELGGAGPRNRYRLLVRASSASMPARISAGR